MVSSGFLFAHAEIIGLLAFILTPVLCMMFSVLCYKLGILDSVRDNPAHPRFRESEVDRELKKQTDLLKRDYEDRLSGYRQGDQVWRKDA